MQISDVTAQTHLVLWAGFLLAVALGALFQRSGFCTMGAVADVVTMGHWGRARMWMLAVGTAAMGFGLMSGAGWVSPAHSFYTVPRLLWLSALVGGGLFGFGMVLASGCGARTLVRVGGGSLKALVVMLVMAVAGYATLRGITAVLRVETVEKAFWLLPVGQDLPALITRSSGTARQMLGLVLGVGFGGALWVWALSTRDGRSATVLWAGAGVGLIVTAMWWVSGVLGFVPEHPETLEPTFLATASRDMEALSFVAPMAQTLDWLILFSDRSKVLTLGMVTTLGVPVGSALVALGTRRFRWEGFGGVEDTANHLVGGVLMGVGGVTAMGCTIGQGLSGLSTLSVGSAMATAAMIGGAVLGLRYQMWRLG